MAHALSRGPTIGWYRNSRNVGYARLPEFAAYLDERGGKKDNGIEEMGWGSLHGRGGMRADNKLPKRSQGRTGAGTDIAIYADR